MQCPNCGATAEEGQPEHGTGCFIAVLLDTLLARGHDLSSIRLDEIDPYQLWERYGGPAADWLASELCLPPYPDDSGISPPSAIRASAG